MSHILVHDLNTLEFLKTYEWFFKLFEDITTLVIVKTFGKLKPKDLKTNVNDFSNFFLYNKNNYGSNSKKVTVKIVKIIHLPYNKQMLIKR